MLEGRVIPGISQLTRRDPPDEEADLGKASNLYILSNLYALYNLGAFLTVFQRAHVSPLPKESLFSVEKLHVETIEHNERGIN